MTDQDAMERDLRDIQGIDDQTAKGAAQVLTEDGWTRQRPDHIALPIPDVFALFVGNRPTEAINKIRALYCDYLDALAPAPDEEANPCTTITKARKAEERELFRQRDLLWCQCLTVLDPREISTVLRRFGENRPDRIFPAGCPVCAGVAAHWGKECPLSPEAGFDPIDKDAA